MDADGNIQALICRVLNSAENGGQGSGGIVLLVLLFVILVMGGGYFGGGESAFSAMNKIRIKSKAENGDKRAKNAMYIANNFDKALTTSLIGNNITHIGAASVSTLIANRIFSDMTDGITWTVTIVTTLIVFLFSEMIPKSFANDRSETTALLFAGSLRFLMKILTPIATFFEWISSLFTKLISKFVKQEVQPSITEEELYEIIDTIEEEGVMNEEQGELFKSALDFSETHAEDVMTMLGDICAIDAGLPNNELLSVVRESVHTRLPVYEGDIDNIIGILHIRTFIKEYIKNPEVDVRTLVMPAFRVSPEAMIDDLLSEMRQHKFYLGIVAKDGKTLGLVTIEDFLEELVGEIWDEDDVVDNDFVKLGGNRTQVNTHMKMGEIYQRLGLPLRRDAGFDKPLLSVVVEHFGRIPNEEESFIYRNMEITVNNIENGAIKNVIIRLLSAEESAELSGKVKLPEGV